MSIWTPPNGFFCPRMSRHGQEPLIDSDPVAYKRAGATLRLATMDLESTLEYVDPVGCSRAFGIRINQFFLSACTEVESAMRGVLKANQYNLPERPSTNDYVRLMSPMALGGYRIQLFGYPDYPEIRPFEHWDSKAPTNSLSWYRDYQNLKHDREENAKLGTVGNLVSACAALLVLGTAQFGQEPFLPEGEFGQRTLFLHGIGSFRENEVYRPNESGGYSPTPYQF